MKISFNFKVVQLINYIIYGYSFYIFFKKIFLLQNFRNILEYKYLEDVFS
jgi:hypothetical protein